MRELKVGTDFSGIGSPEEALKKLKIKHQVVFSCEIDKYARKSYAEMHDSKKVYEDITTRNHSEVPKLDLYVAGFPCQAFSIAGKQRGFEDVRGTLFFNVADFIRENQPKTFILENVKGLVSHDGGKTFQTIIDLLSNGGGTVNGQMSMDFFQDGLGYHIYHKVLNTKEHGIPQNRERIFIVGFKKSRNYSFPVKEPLKLKLKDLLEDSVDEKYFLSDKAISRFIRHPRAIGFKDPKDYEVANCLVSGYNKLPGDGLYLKVNSNTKKGFEEAKEVDSINYSVPTSKTRRGRVGKQVSQTLDTACNMEVVQLNKSKESGGKQPYQQNRIYDSEGISPALLRDKSDLIIQENIKIRRLTPLECWRLQGFSDESFYKAEKVNSNTQLYKQAGNSITVNVIEKVIKNIYG